MKPSYKSSSHKNPSRKSCEQTILKILTREYEEFGTNQHFKQASDFMVYFESLHPASPGLTKQVQRAVHSLNLPRDQHGYFLINKTAEEYQAERELSHLLHDTELIDLATCTPLFLKADPWLQTSIIHLIESCPGLQDLYETIVKSNNGILIYTKDPQRLSQYLEGLFI